MNDPLPSSYRTHYQLRRRRATYTFIGILVFVVLMCVVGVLLYNWPPVHTRLAWRLDEIPYAGITVACLLYCSGLGTDAFVQAPVLIALDSAWYRYERNIAAFRQAQWQKDDWQREHRPLLDSDSCLDQVTAIGIALQPDMSDGVRAIADFVVDSIYVQ